MSADAVIKRVREFSLPYITSLATENVITCEELWRLVEESDEYIVLVDTRSDVEINVSRIRGSITYSEYKERMDNENIPFVKTICYSTIGKRSCEIVRDLIKKGVKAYSLDGGLVKWCNFEQGEIVDSKGEPTHMLHVFNQVYRSLLHPSFICVY